MYVVILGRQPALGVGELERLHGGDAVRWFSDQSATVSVDDFSIDGLGGTQKAGRIRIELSRADWRKASIKIVQEYQKIWANFDGKLTLGISAYGFDASPRDIQKTGIILKQKLKNSGVSLRLIPNTDAALSSATSHHNKLGTAPNKVELIVIRSRDGRVIIAESIGTQNITAYALRDQKRPKRDAFVGMLPPKLAQIMINLASNPSSRLAISVSKHLQPKNKATSGPDFILGAKPFVNGDSRKGDHENMRLLDPFCGTGVILQEGALMGYAVYGTDLADKMIDFSRANLDWLADSHHISPTVTLHQGDATTTTWQQPIDAVACETYLGQPFSAPPSPSKLTEVRGNCDFIISSFLKNLAPQLVAGTPLCVAVPAWRGHDGSLTHLPLISQLDKLGYTRVEFKNITPDDLIYYREDQVVARELLVLTRSNHAQ